MPIWLGRLVLVAIVALIVGAFILTGYGSPGDSSGLLIARVDGEAIDRETFEYFREGTEQTLAALADQLPTNAARRDFLDEQTRAALLRRRILRREARQLGMEVPDAELRDDLHSNPQFQTDGVFDRELVELFAANSRLGMGGLMEEYRNDLFVRKFRRLAEGPVRVSRAQVRWEAERAATQVSLRYAVARAADFSAGIEVSEEEVQTLLAEEERAVRDAYASRSAEFQRPEEIRARHVLLSGEGARERAAAALERLRAGEAFEEVAAELSNDEATAEQGGDLGWFPRGIFVEGFDQVAFSLEPGQLSEPVETERGWHVIRLEERREALDRSFEDATPELARQLLRDRRAREAARAAAERVLEAVRGGADLDAAASAEGLEISTTPPFGVRDRTVPGLRELGGLVELGFALSEEHPAAPRVLEAGDRFYAVALAQRSPPDPAEIEAEVQTQLDRATDLARSEASAIWYQVRRNELDEAGKIELYPLYR